VPDWWARDREMRFLAPGRRVGDLSPDAIADELFSPVLPIVASSSKTAELAALVKRFPRMRLEPHLGNSPDEIAFYVCRDVERGEEADSSTIARNDSPEARMSITKTTAALSLAVACACCGGSKETAAPAGTSAAAAPQKRSAGLAQDKPFQASSAYEKFPQSGTVTGDMSAPFFFHTQEEENPWMEIDLGTAQDVKEVEILNRPDCCADRAIPLVVEVGVDRAAFKEVARRTEAFTTWKAEFPTEKARFVRIKSPRKTFLHVQFIRVG
jgi:hypothetical protein